MCTKCFEEYAQTDFPNMKCGICNVVVGESYKKMMLKSLYDDLDIKFSLGNQLQIIQCVVCKEKNTFEPGSVDYNIKDSNNKLISKSSAEHYAQYRCRCFNCKQDFCTKCALTPYHLGKTCEEHKAYTQCVHCRYCNAIITSTNKGVNDDTCNNEDCTTRYNISCPKLLNCGHRCPGCKYETQCLTCIDSSCNNYTNIFDQDSDTFCNICFTEGLGNSPIVLLTCNHYLHYECVLTRLQKKWPGPKITFSHCLCPCCNKWLDCPTVPPLQSMITEYKQLYNKICEMAEKRLSYEGLDKDERLRDPNSPWYKNKIAFAMNRLSYYMCYECNNPYFAGRRECGDGPNNNGDDPNNAYNPKDLICGRHNKDVNVAGVNTCKIHGKDFIEFKCRYCCRVASWYCWGTTHFCDECHKRQCAGDYVSKYPIDKLPKCDPKVCEVGGKHPPNGTEYAIGCSVCKNTLEMIKNF